MTPVAGVGGGRQPVQAHGFLGGEERLLPAPGIATAPRQHAVQPTEPNRVGGGGQAPGDQDFRDRQDPGIQVDVAAVRQPGLDGLQDGQQLGAEAIVVRVRAAEASVVRPVVCPVKPHREGF